MATTVDITNTPGASYTFASYTQTFAAADSGILTFETAAINQWAAAVGDTVANVEVLASVPGKANAEAFSVAEVLVKDIDEVTAETLPIAEGLAHVWGSIMALAETIGIAEAVAKLSVQDDFAEAFAVAEVRRSDGDKESGDTLGFAEDPDSLTTWKRTYTEAFANVDDQGSGVAKAIAEAVDFTDLLYRNADAIWQELQIRGAPLSSDDIIALLNEDAPIGYSPLVDFIAGDYDYQKAFFRVLLSPAATDSRPALLHANLTADMPDVIQSGTATISAAGVVDVLFDKSFTVPPAVAVVMLTAATGCTAVVVGSPTAAGFTCGLLVSPGVYTTGSLSWTAVGR